MRHDLIRPRGAELNRSLLNLAGNLPDGSLWSFCTVGTRQLSTGKIHE